MGRDRRTPGEPHYRVPSFDLRGGSCGVTTWAWGGCVDGGDAAVAVGDSLLWLGGCLPVAVVPKPEPDADTGAGEGAGDDVEALAPFRAVGVFALALPLEEASRWSSALRASAL